MTIQIEMPDVVRHSLENQGLDAQQVTKEAALVELFRQGHIDHSMLAHALGVSRYEADGVLKSHGILLDIRTDQLDSDLEGLRRLIRP